MKNSAPKYNSKFSPRTWCISLAVTRKIWCLQNYSCTIDTIWMIMLRKNCLFADLLYRRENHMHDQMTHRTMDSTKTCSIAYTTNVTDETNAMWTWKWSLLKAGLLFGLPFYLFRAINLHCCVFPARDSDARLSLSV